MLRAGLRLVIPLALLIGSALSAGAAQVAAFGWFRRLQTWLPALSRHSTRSSFKIERVGVRARSGLHAIQAKERCWKLQYWR